MQKSSVQKNKNNDFNKHNMLIDIILSLQGGRNCCSSKVCCFEKEQDIRKYIVQQVARKKEKHPNFDLGVITTSVINTSTCEINTI